jgi:hypothetical protein
MDSPLYNPSGSNQPSMFGGGSGTSGSNQFTPYPMPSMSTPGNTNAPVKQIMQWPGGGNNPYQVPTQGPAGGQYYPWGSADPNYGGAAKQGRTTNPGSENIGSGIVATGLQYGGLSQDFADYLMSQIGGGLTPFNLQTMLPTGGMTQPGQLTAGMNPLLSQLSNFFMTGQGGGVPGLQQMGNIANNGISALPEWQSMIQAQQQNIQQNQANLKEQFGYMGNLAGSPAATGLSNYAQQTTADQNALLGQLQQQNILQGQIPLMQNLFGGAQQMAGGLQGLDQQAIQNMYQEFQRVSPQNNPLMQYIMGLSTLYPPTTKTPSTWENINSTLGALSGSGFSTGGSGGTGITF